MSTSVSTDPAHHSATNGHSARPVVRIGSRPSALAKIQANLVHKRLSALYPTHDFHLSTKVISVAGDRDKVLPLRSLNRAAEKNNASLWTTELEDALLAGELDVLVHSMKDVPTTVRPGCEVAPVLPRANHTDCLVVKAGLSFKSLGDLPAGSTVGTGSVRRIAQLKRRFPGLLFQDCRGNIDTRLQKLDNPDGPFSALILASAGLLRLDLAHRITAYLAPPDVYPAVGQGMLGAEYLADNAAVRALVLSIEDWASGWAVRAERALLRVLEGGCAVPVGVWATATDVNEGAHTLRLTLRAVLTSPDGAREVSVERDAVLSAPEDAEALGRHTAQVLISEGGREIMDALRAELAKANEEHLAAQP